MSALIDGALETIARTTGAPYGSAPGPLGSRLAAALGWDHGSARVEHHPVRGITFDFARGFLGPQRAVLFATPGPDRTQSLLSDGALFAYHSSIRWGMVVDEESATIFNSHWIHNDQWFRLPPITWSAIDANKDLLKAFSPSGLATGRIDQIAAAIQSPDRLLTPVDDALVARLDYWRHEALRFGQSAEGLDQDLHTLFAQLFVLRAVEDRGLAPTIPPLQSTVVGLNLDKRQLQELFHSAREAIQSQLFVDDGLGRFPDFILAGIINDLYYPAQLPPGSQRYNFAWIDADILGRAYEKYLSNIFTGMAPPAQLYLFEQPIREIEPISVKKSAGIYYTPSYLVSTLTEQALDRTLADCPTDFLPRIADFACGSGSFLVEAVDLLLKRLRQRDSTHNWARTLIEQQRIIGIDIDPRAVSLTRMNLWIRFTDEPDALPLPSIDEVIVVGDSLRSEVWKIVPESYDIVVGNPPFVATIGTQFRDELARRFRTAQGRFDYAHLFLELAIQRLNPGGVLGMVIPNRLYRNRDAGPVRQILASETSLICIIDFGANPVFEQTSAYIGAVLARKQTSQTTPHPELVRAVVVYDISEARYLGAALADAINGHLEVQTAVLSAFQVDHPSGAEPWILMPPSARRARLRLEEQSDSLGDFAGIYQGIRTGANDIFIVELISTDGSVARAMNLLGEADIIDLALLHPVVFGSDIQRYETVDPKRMLLYPYHQGSVIPETELKDQYQATYRYILRYRELLANRNSIKSSGLRWYELVRRRDESWLSASKLLTRDLAVRTSFAPDIAGGIYLVGGTAVVPPTPDHLLPLLAFLNSRAANEYLSSITPGFRGGFQKFEPQHLARLPIPRFIIDLDEKAVQLGDKATMVLEASREGKEDLRLRIEGEINEVIDRAVSISSE